MCCYEMKIIDISKMHVIRQCDLSVNHNTDTMRSGQIGYGIQIGSYLVVQPRAVNSYANNTRCRNK